MKEVFRFVKQVAFGVLILWGVFMFGGVIDAAAKYWFFRDGDELRFGNTAASPDISVQWNSTNLAIQDAADNTFGTVTDAGTTGTLAWAGDATVTGIITGSNTANAIRVGTLCDLTTPPAIGGTTPAAIKGTTVEATGITTLGETVKMASGKYVWFDSTGAFRLGYNGTTLDITDAAPNVFATITDAGTTGTLAWAGAMTVGLTLGVTGDTTLTGDIAVNGGDVTSTAATVNLFNATVTKLNIGGAAAIDLSGAGLMTTVKGTLNVDEAVTFDTTLNVTGVVTAANAANAIVIGSACTMSSPPAIGGVAPAAGTFTTLASTSLSGGVLTTPTIGQLAEADATPAVGTANVWRCYGKTGLTITNFDSPSGAQVIHVLGAYLNEQQTVIVTNGDPGDTFTLTYSGQTTAALAWDCSAAQMVTALEALSNIEAGDVTVVLAPAGTYTVTFQGTLAETDVDEMTSTPTGCNVAHATTVAGGGANTSIVQDGATLQLVGDWTMNGDAQLTLVYDTKKTLWRELSRTDTTP